MSRIESEWIVLWAIVAAGLIPAPAALRLSGLTLGKGSIMKKCPTCGHLYFSICPDCEFRYRPEPAEEDEGDLCDRMADTSAQRLEAAFQWMGVQQ